MSEGTPFPDSSPTAMRDVKALTFDVFGTTVDWRTSIEAALKRALDDKIASPAFAALPAELQARARRLHARGGDGDVDGSRPRRGCQQPAPEQLTEWPGGFAAAWRRSYGRFTRGFEPGVTPWKDIDAHHRESLARLLRERGLDGLFGPDEVLRLSRAWHALDPWPDVRRGLRDLGRLGLATAALSNGNRALLRDLNAHGDGLGLDSLCSAEDFGAYKPNPRTYLGAAEHLGLPPDQVAMVAAHLSDLHGAKMCGLRTVYVERAGEEEWSSSEDRYEAATRWVDVWISLSDSDEGGFVELARRLHDIKA